MPLQPLPMSPDYLAMVRGVLELHLLNREGKEDSPEADAIRDATDTHWEALSESERDRIRNLSEDLYSLQEPISLYPPSHPHIDSKIIEVIFHAQANGEWDTALDILRKFSTHLDPGLVSYLRGMIWSRAGDSVAADLFFHHATHLAQHQQ